MKMVEIDPADVKDMPEVKPVPMTDMESGPDAKTVKVPNPYQK